MPEIIAQTHPLRPGRVRELDGTEGATIREHVDRLRLDPRYGPPVVTLHRDGHAWEVGPSLWGHVRPKRGTRIEVGYRVQGQVVLAAAAAVAGSGSAFASWVAAGSAAAAAGSVALGYTLAVAAINVVIGLALNALIAPAQEPGEPDAVERNYTVSGTRNRSALGRPVPMPYGRVRVFPPLAASGYVDHVGWDETFFHGAYILGVGPLCLEDLRIGDTSIAEYQDVSIEFLNVDRAQTEARMPWLTEPGRDVRWRAGLGPMTLYPSDVDFQQVGAALNMFDPVVRTTPGNTRHARVAVAYPQGIFFTTDEGSTRPLAVEHDFWYRAAGSGAPWVFAGRDRTRRGKRKPFVATWHIWFPSAGAWEVRVRRVAEDTRGSEDQRVYDSQWLSLASFQVDPAGQLALRAPGPDVAQVAIRIRATEQLNGAVDDLNCIVHRMTRTYQTGVGFSAYQPTRHPAWAYLDMLKKAGVPDDQIDLDYIANWATSEQTWRCDYVFDGETTLGEALDLVAGTGRAKRGHRDFQHSVIREPWWNTTPRQIVTPRNSWGFEAELIFPDPAHGVRCIVRSEALGWAEDERIVYADGYDAGTADPRRILDLPLPGSVLAASDTALGPIYWLAKYFLEVTRKRRETFRWNMDFESVVVQRGDVVELRHDVPKIGVGQARVIATDAGQQTLQLDDPINLVQGNQYRLRVRRPDLTFLEMIATVTDAAAGVLQRNSGDFASAAGVGDLVSITLTTEAVQLLIVTAVEPDTDESARISAQPLADAWPPEFAGVDPAYNPIVTEIPLGEREIGPARPVPAEIISDERTAIENADGSRAARAEVRMLEPIGVNQAPTSLQLRWREVGTTGWEVGAAQPGTETRLATGALTPGSQYEVQARSASEIGRTRGWTGMGVVLAATRTGPPPDVANLQAVVLADGIDLRWQAVRDQPDVRAALVRYSADAAATWDQAALIEEVPHPLASYRVPPRQGVYWLRRVTWDGASSAAPASVTVAAAELTGGNAVETLTWADTWTGTLTGVEVDDADDLRLSFVVPTLLDSAGEAIQDEDGNDILADAPDAYAPEGSFVADDTIDLGAVYPVTVLAEAAWVAASFEDIVVEWGPIVERDPLIVNVTEFAAVAVDVSVKDTAAGSGTWGPWREIVGQTVATARSFRFRVRLVSKLRHVTPIVSLVRVTVDMPDRVEGQAGLSVASGGTSVAFSPAFAAVPQVTVTQIGGADGDTVNVSNRTAGGFDVQVLDSAGTGKAATVDWQARGYGRQQ